MAYRRRTKKASTKSQGKIKHTKTEVDGIMFDSKMESNFYLKLKADMESGQIQDFTLQPKFTLLEAYIVVDGEVIYKSDERFNKIKRKTKAPTTRAIEYIGDFYVLANDGTGYIIDTKGLSTKEFEIKKKLFMALYPQYSLQVIIYDSVEDEWVDYYKFQKIDKQRKAERKAKREADKAQKEAEKATKKAEREAKKALNK